jgi:antitoxin component HigA of HigAB toxin-antitoxin module
MNNEMANKTIKFLEAHSSDTPSRFVEEANWRKENAGWLKWSRQLATALMGYMQDNGLKRADLAARLGVSPQYVSKLLSGTENLSFKSVANIEDRLGINCFVMINT